MAGMFRGGHARPTFDTPVEFVAVNQTATDKSGGYGSPQVSRGDWGAPEVMTETTLADRDDFEPTGDSGVQATTLGMFAWYTEGDTQTLLYQEKTYDDAYYRTRNRNGDGWGVSSKWIGHDGYVSVLDANRGRLPLPFPKFIIVSASRIQNVRNNLPNISSGNFNRIGILVDDDTGQSLYYCNNQVNRCEHYRRAIDDGLGPASRTYMADVKDVASAERVVGDQTIAVRTKSLVFAAATLAPLLAAEGSLSKDWKVRIDGRDMDIVGVMDGWVPNRYARLIVEERS